MYVSWHHAIDTKHGHILAKFGRFFKTYSSVREPIRHPNACFFNENGSE
jgi:hypothetical protein